MPVSVATNKQLLNNVLVTSVQYVFTNHYRTLLIIQFRSMQLEAALKELSPRRAGGGGV